ncbi:NACHT domain-containing protein [Streptomyces sp. CB01580]|uniref:NACHT domain-containing protein n=1 Tax=Streptomyces sp. CB01580 TaxID=1703933 RepID=UPI001300F540|nr:NACHT domain-containing protein [Streptomyces sp. CB01580]
MSSVVVCLFGLWWSMREVGQTDDANNIAGLWSFLTGLVSAVVGGWALWLAVVALRGQRTPSVIAEELAQAVVRAEGVEYRQLLGSGAAVPDGRIDLAFTATVTNVDGARPQGTLEEITAYYKALRPGRMVITGTPALRPDGQVSGDAGTGKTVLALALLLGLAKDRTAQAPVPVRLIAASWPGNEIREWVRTHLTDTYRLPAREASSIVAANLVLPVIDGLDEMESDPAPGYTSRASQLLRAIERFEHGDTHCPVILTCRQAPYQALVDAGAEPGVVAQVALARVDAAHAGQYLRQRVGTTERGRARWQPVLNALTAVAAASPTNPASPADVVLAGTLDTPWRLTLAATVFEERTPNGQYRRDPADLLALAANGYLYEYLLDRYIGAAVTAPRHEADNTGGSAPRNRRKQLVADTTWRRLAVLARYLDSNTGTGGEPPRTVAGRTLSSTDLILHELWPLVGRYRVRWTEQMLVILSVAGSLYLMVGLKYSLGDLFPIALFMTSALIYRRAWPNPQRIDFRRLRTRAGWGAAALGSALGIMLGFLITFVILYADSSGTEQFDPTDLVATATLFAIPLGAGLGFALGLVSKKQTTSAGPLILVRKDFTTGATLASVIALLLFLNARYGTPVANFFAPEGVSYTASDSALDALTPGLLLGLLAFVLPFKGSSVALRHLAFLLNTRRSLPWRLGRFLNSCYQVGILRVAGTAWQFRHRELQDHLATRPTPPPHP